VELLKLFLGGFEEVLFMAPLHLLDLARLLETLQRVLANRLEHPVALVGEAEQALLDVRLEGVERGAADLLRRLERAAAREDAEAGEELLLSGEEELVRPVDGRPERDLTGIGVAAAREQVEPGGEALEDLSRCKGSCAGGGQLDGERQVVEAAA